MNFSRLIFGVFETAKTYLYKFILYPIKFFFNLPWYIHIITFILFMLFALFIARAVWLNRQEIFGIT